LGLTSSSWIHAQKPFVHVRLIPIKDTLEEGRVKNNDFPCGATRGAVVALAERELASFIRAVMELFGQEQAKHAADAWLEEFDLARLAEAKRRDWRHVTIAAAARLTQRLSFSLPPARNVCILTDTISSAQSSYCFITSSPA
jgi:hypothetical protein